MVIEKILNNNVVVTKNDEGEEIIVMGRGLAFKKQVGDDIDPAMVDKVFQLTSKAAKSKFQEMVADIPLENLELAEEIIAYAKLHLGKRLNELIYISLVDHLYTAISRFLEGITVKNALLWDIRRFYPDEFYVGMKALEMVEQRCKVRLPEDEAGFIALHLVNAEMDETGMQDMYQITKIMQEILNLIKYVFNTDFDEESVYYYRFISHLKFFAQRLVNGNVYEDSQDDGLYDVIKAKYRNSYSCVCKIAEFISKKYQHELTDEEKLYLTIHIERVVYKSKKEE